MKIFYHNTPANRKLLKKIMQEKLKQIGEFLSRRRNQMGRTRQELADFLALDIQTIEQVENGSNHSIDILLQVCEALEIKPFFVPLEETKSLRSNGTDLIHPFLFCPDQRNEELFILHRNFPACLIQVVQSQPASFRIIEVYDDIEEEELIIHPFLQKAKEFYISYNNGEN